MFIKICANTNLYDAQLAASLGADAVGFVFAPSKRQVTAEQVAAITPHLPPGIETFGVFSTTDPFEIEHVVASAELSGAQLHAAYNPATVRDLAAEFGADLKIIQTVHYPLDPPDRPAADDRFQQTLASVLADTSVWAVLIDAAKSGTSGGLGVAFDWLHTGQLVSSAIAAGNSQNRRIMLAGGLTSANVAEAIQRFHPWGVDVASGVEKSFGIKDPEKLRAFIETARATSK